MNTDNTTIIFPSEVEFQKCMCHNDEDLKIIALNIANTDNYFALVEDNKKLRYVEIKIDGHTRLYPSINKIQHYLYMDLFNEKIFITPNFFNVTPENFEKLNVNIMYVTKPQEKLEEYSNLPTEILLAGAGFIIHAEYLADSFDFCLQSLKI